ncbi:MAG: hypothetical protein JSV18_03410 [Candidatus Bathyarchaeota archaeon]|nr:MAG: hypothetical protein JSV18_03410 [Candidatus Bathyarchaeota archaeon]
MTASDHRGSTATRDAIIYILLFAAIAWGFQMVPSAWLERFTAETTSILLNFLGLTSGYGVVDGDAYLTLAGIRDVSVVIVRECTAIHVWGILAALVLPVNGGTWLRKAASLAVGGLMVFLMNISRISLTVYLTGFDVPPFTWFLTSPTVETYHYPISFIYGVIGVATLILTISRWILPELGDTLIGIPRGFMRILDRDKEYASRTSRDERKNVT